MSKTQKTQITCEEGKGFLNQAIEKSKDNAPDFFGALNLNGTMLDVAGWSKTGEKSGENYLSLNVDKMDDSQDVREAKKKQIIKDYKADKKANPNEFIVMESTGTMHRQKDVDKDEDYFAKIVFEGETHFLKGFASSSKDGVAYIKLYVDKGFMDKATRNKIAEGLF